MPWRFLLRPFAVAITKTTHSEVKIYNNTKQENSYIDIDCFIMEILSFEYKNTII